MSEIRLQEDITRFIEKTSHVEPSQLYHTYMNELNGFNSYHYFYSKEKQLPILEMENTIEMSEYLNELSKMIRTNPIKEQSLYELLNIVLKHFCFEEKYAKFIELARMMNQQKIPKNKIISLLKEKMSSTHDIHKIMCIITEGESWDQRSWEI